MPSTSATKRQPPQASSDAPASKKRKADPNAQKYYAVRAGAKPGVYLTWSECQEQTAGFRGASYKSFLSREDAEAFVAGKKVPAPADEEEKYYAVAVGRQPGIYRHWDDASLAIKGWKGPKYKKFGTRKEAREFILKYGTEEAQLQVAAEDGEPPAKKSKKSTSKSVPVLNEPDVEYIYTDGSSLGNGAHGAVAGVGVYFGEGDPRNVSEKLEGDHQTNQRAELTAVLRALEKTDIDDKIRIFTDSSYAIKCVTEWYKKWEQNEWKTIKGPVVNKDLVILIRAKLQEREENGEPALFQWVKGHADNPGNVAADKLAVQGARRG